MTEQTRRQFTALVAFLGETLGPDYEVVLHELEGDDCGVVAIANGSISGRYVGSPMTKVSLEMIRDKRYANSDFIPNYLGQLNNGKIIRCSSMFIKEGGKPTGMLCINFDDSRYHELSERLMKLVHPDSFVSNHYRGKMQGLLDRETQGSVDASGTERFISDTEGLLSEIFSDVVKYSEEEIERLAPKERTALVTRLYEHGMFQFRGSVAYVSDKLHYSQASIYRCISKLKSN